MLLNECSRAKGVFALVLMLLSCGLVQEARGQAWKRHVIDDSLLGADGVRLADFDGDGLQDVVTGWEESGVVRLYLNPGAAKSKLAWPAVTVGAIPSPEDAVAMDIDGDKQLEILSCHEGKARQVVVHRLDGKATRQNLLKPKLWRSQAVPELNGKPWMFAEPRAGITGQAFVGAKRNCATISLATFLGNACTVREIRAVGWVMTLKEIDMDGDGDRDLAFSDRYGSRRGVGWMECPGDEGGDWREHPIGGDDVEVMFMDATQERILVATRRNGILDFRRNGEDWTQETIKTPPGVRLGKAVRDFGQGRLVFSANTAAAKKENPEMPGLWLRDTDGNWSVIDPTTDVKFDRIELIDLDGDGDLDLMTCEERRNLGVVWYENPET